jgi:transcriptional regulator with XRE-family HTH domain
MPKTGPEGKISRGLPRAGLMRCSATLSISKRRTLPANCFCPQCFYYCGVTEIHRNLVRNMKRHRTLLGISQMELAERSGLSVGYVGEIEMGRKYPSDKKLEAIAKALGVKPFRLIMGPEDLTDALGQDALYETAGRIKERLERELDEIVRGMDPKARPAQDERKKRGR